MKGNRVYSPETCCFVPNEINCLFIRNKRIRGELPIGVNKSGKRFSARLSKGLDNRVFLGSFKTETEAFLSYKKAKEMYLKELAEKWKGKIDDRAYDVLMNYEVNIDD